jgi:hypothetical protein
MPASNIRKQLEHAIKQSTREALPSTMAAMSKSLVQSDKPRSGGTATKEWFREGTAHRGVIGKTITPAHPRFERRKSERTRRR